MRGLLGTRRLEAGDGLWLRPCRQVHMIGMRYAIDVVFLDDDHRVVHVIESLAPGRFSPRVPEATSVLELPTGMVASTGLAPGARVSIDSEPGPRRLGIGPAVCNGALALLFLLFALIHWSYARRTGQWATTVPIVVQELVLVGLFFTRRRTTVSSERPLDWVLGIVGTFAPLFLRPVGAGVLGPVGPTLQIIGTFLAVAAVAGLGRSIGVVAANRGVRTEGLYRFVRHPMYASHLIAYAGYGIAHPSGRNVAITLLVAIVLHARAVVEERLLSGDPAYRAYLGRARWRFVPLVY
jgi:protein-S-isoprenylcysteine O-methyltransferase Ste14/uncharacterized membrane protein (UPF0127 family)